MMDAIVQFIRNALCCVKDLNWFPDTFLHQSNHTDALLLGISGSPVPEPLNHTTPLEVMISITQLYACISMTIGGATLMYTSVGKLRRIVRLLESRLNDSTTATKSTVVTKTANRIVNESLLQQAKLAIRGSFIGVLVAPIGIAFFWLFANSWHITETPWLGGLVALIDALSVMEICLLPLLVYMIMDGMQYIDKRKQTQEWIDIIESNQLTPSSIKVSTYEIMVPDWTPFWESGASPLMVASSAEESKQIQQELNTIEKNLIQWFPPQTEDEAKKDEKENEKEEKIRTQTLGRIVRSMTDSLFVLTIKGYREWLYFLLNFIAFYGYLMGIVAFYYPDDTAQPSYVKTLKFGYGNAIADWTGNFAGDLMWTIEPLIILSSPYYLTFMKSTASKPKQQKQTEEKTKKE